MRCQVAEFGGMPLATGFRFILLFGVGCAWKFIHWVPARAVALETGQAQCSSLLVFLARWSGRLEREAEALVRRPRCMRTAFCDADGAGRGSPQKHISIYLKIYVCQCRWLCIIDVYICIICTCMLYIYMQICVYICSYMSIYT